MNAPLKHASTLFLKTVLVLLGAAVLALAGFTFPHVWRGAPAAWPTLAGTLYPAIVAVYATVVPFLVALLQAFRLLRAIDRNDAFSASSEKALGAIAYCALAMTALYACAMPFVFALADSDDAPGAVLIGAAIACAPLIVATFAAVLKKLVRSAIDLKTENDLTI
jgi:hypothetical protein